MLSKEEFKNRKINFWTSLESEMRNVRGAHGNKIDWLRYKSRIKDLYFRMEFDSKGARLCMDLQHSDTGIRALFLEQFSELRLMLSECFDKEVKFSEDFILKPAEIEISRIYVENDELNFYDDEDLPIAKSFLKDQLISLDQFWSEFKDVFLALQ